MEVGHDTMNDCQDVWDKDYSDIVIDWEIIKDFSSKYRGSVRMSAGLFFTNEEYKEYREEILMRKLP